MADTALAVPCVLDVQWLGYWGEQPAGIACGEPSFATASPACPHEHVDTARICSGCAVDVLQARGMLTCKRCWDALGQRHKCMMPVVIDWDSGEKTIIQEAGRD